SPPINNLAYAVAVETLLGVEGPPRADALRVIMSELTRLSSHLVWLGTSGIELGASTMLMYCFRERDTILDMNEEISGFRMHTSYIRPGGVMADATPRFLEMLDRFIHDMPGHVDEYENLLTNNPIWRSRTIGIGRLSAEDAKVLGATGPMLRGSGVAWDLRRSMPYSGYENYDFEIATSDMCDCYGRYLVRIKEMREAVKSLRQALDRLGDGPVGARAGGDSRAPGEISTVPLGGDARARPRPGGDGAPDAGGDDRGRAGAAARPRLCRGRRDLLFLVSSRAGRQTSLLRVHEPQLHAAGRERDRGSR